MTVKNVYTPLRPLFLLALGLGLAGVLHAENLNNYAYHAKIKSEGAGPFFHLPLTMSVYRPMPNLPSCWTRNARIVGMCALR